MENISRKIRKEKHETPNEVEIFESSKEDPSETQKFGEAYILTLWQTHGSIVTYELLTCKFWLKSLVARSQIGDISSSQKSQKVFRERGRN